MTTITILDSGMGNIGSLANMVEKVGGKVSIATTGEEAMAAEKIILPGVGSFDNGMKKLMEHGFVEALQKKVINERVPVLAICLGMHLLTKGSEEGILPGLGYVDAKTVKFDLTGFPGLRVPHMGWNEANVQKDSRLFAGIQEAPMFYFVHSYHVVCNNPETVLATTQYGRDFVSAIEQGNIMATQFHPEKSHKNGMHMMRNFVELV